jgi:hypothetical protein
MLLRIEISTGSNWASDHDRRRLTRRIVADVAEATHELGLTVERIQVVRAKKTKA